MRRFVTPRAAVAVAICLVGAGLAGSASAQELGLTSMRWSCGGSGSRPTPRTSPTAAFTRASDDRVTTPTPKW